LLLATACKLPMARCKA